MSDVWFYTWYVNTNVNTRQKTFFRKSKINVWQKIDDVIICTREQVISDNFLLMLSQVYM